MADCERTHLDESGRKNIYLLGATSLFNDISSEMIYPLIPLFLTGVLGATPAIVGLIEGIAESLAALLRVVSGNISDRLKRRKDLALAGYSLSTLAKVFFYLAGSWGMVLLGRIGDRFGKGVRTAPRDALIAESAPAGRTGSAFGLHRAMDTIGAAVGVGIAYYFIKTNLGSMRSVFLWALLPAGLALLCLLLVKERRESGWPGRGYSTTVTSKNVAHWQGKGQKTRTPLPGLKLTDWVDSWRSLSPTLKGFLIVSFIFTLGNSSNQFLLLRASIAGFNTANVLLLYLLFNISYSLAAYPAGRLMDRIGPRYLIVGGYIAYSAVYTGFALFDSTRAIALLFLLYGLYLAMTHGVEKALIADLSPAIARGTLLGFHATLEGIGLFPASLLAGWLWNSFGFRYALGLGGLTGFIAALGMQIVLAKGR